MSKGEPCMKNVQWLSIQMEGDWALQNLPSINKESVSSWAPRSGEYLNNGRFSKHFRGANGFAEYFRGNMYLTNTCKILSVSFVFHKKKHIRELRLKQKIDFIIKKSCFSLWSTTFLGICQLSGTWGHCAPLPP